MSRSNIFLQKMPHVSLRPEDEIVSIPIPLDKNYILHRPSLMKHVDTANAILW